MGCTAKDDSNSVSVVIHVSDTVSNMASVTGKYAFWRFNDFYKTKNAVISFERKSKYAELLHITMNKSYNSLDCFMENRESVEISFQQNKYEIIGTSTTSQQNRFLQKIDEIRKSESPNECSSVSSILRKSTEEKYADIERMIVEFENKYPERSQNFINYLHIDNKYYKILCDLNLSQGVSNTYIRYNEAQRNLLSATAKEPNEQIALLSANYRAVLFAYIDYLRIADPSHLLGSGSEFIQNEIKLSKYLPSAVLREYVVSKNIVELLPYINIDSQTQHLLKRNNSNWTSIIQSEQKKLAKQKKDYEVQLPFKPDISGIDKNLHRFNPDELKGKWLLVFFWSVKCNISENELHYLQQIKDYFPGSELEILGISVDDVEFLSDWKLFVSNGKIVGKQILCNNKDMLFEQFGINHLPHFSIIAPDGNVMYNNIPLPSTGMSHKLLKDLLETN